MTSGQQRLSPWLALPVAFAALAGGLVGCAEKPKEKVIDIKAPGVSIEVERGSDSADVKVRTNEDKND